MATIPNSGACPASESARGSRPSLRGSNAQRKRMANATKPSHRIALIERARGRSPSERESRRKLIRTTQIYPASVVGQDVLREDQNGNTGCDAELGIPGQWDWASCCEETWSGSLNSTSLSCMTPNTAVPAKSKTSKKAERNRTRGFLRLVRALQAVTSFTSATGGRPTSGSSSNRNGPSSESTSNGASISSGSTAASWSPAVHESPARLRSGKLALNFSRASDREKLSDSFSTWFEFRLAGS